MISTSPTSEERERYSVWLSEAESAWHRLATGAAEVSVSHDGESVTYTVANRAALTAYIAQLRQALGMAPVRNPGVSFRPVAFGHRPRGAGGLF